MKKIHFVCFAGVLVSASSALIAADAIELPSVTVGQNLETAVSATLADAPAEAGGEITVTSADPLRLLLSVARGTKGSPSINVAVPRGRRQSLEFYVQATGKTGQVTYTATASHLGAIGPATGVITVAPSGFVVSAGAPGTTDHVTTTAGAPPRNYRVYPALLDDKMRFVATQLVAGGSEVTINLTSSDPAVGVIAPAHVTISGGEEFARIQFTPQSAGVTKLAADVPSGFGSPAQFRELTATVLGRTLTMSGQTTVGKDLQSCGSLNIGDAAPTGGVAVALTSDNANLLFSADRLTVGFPALTITVPEGANHAPYCLQALSDTGAAHITAAAAGRRSYTTTVQLAPSGVFFGLQPPDEAELWRKDAAERDHGGVAELSRKKEFKIYTASLDPTTHRGADLTIQNLRPGVSISLEVHSSDPSVGTIASPVIINGTNGEASVEFTPLREGRTVITMSTPPGFTAPTNSTSYTIIVLDPSATARR